jgi:uncharacterized iron-regulated protein
MALLFIFQACAISPKPAVPKDPLVGKIIDAREKTPVSFDKLMGELADRDVIYLSEKHDNPIHHAIQARIIKDMGAQGKAPVIGFEFFSMDQTPLLLNFVDSKKAGHTPKMETAIKKQMRKKLGWEDQSDEMWHFYYDLLALAKDNSLWAAGLDLTPSQKRRITRKGMDGLTPLEQNMIYSTGLNVPEYEARMRAIFKQVHCGMGNDKMTARLYEAWLARNDKMALSITQLHKAALDADPPQGPVVVIMGNGHTEYGLGVMDRVRAIDPNIRQINISLTEIFREPAELEDYLLPLELEGYDRVFPADYIWFTQRVSDQDPCEKFKTALDRMNRMKNNKN